ncbi:MAG: helix-turn-helix domain-containing protein [Chryseolinea sp.]
MNLFTSTDELFIGFIACAGMTTHMNVLNNHSLENAIAGDTDIIIDSDNCTPSSECPGESLLKLLASKWKPQIIRVAMDGAIRFNSLLRQLPGSNKQAIALALRELEEAQVLRKEVINRKPLHIEYSLTERGKSMLSIFSLASTIEISHKQAMESNNVSSL